VKVQLPLAGPTILQGINQTTLLALSMVVIASMIGARGVGETVLLGLQRNDLGMGLVGGIVICILAILLDRTMQGAGVRWQTRSVWQGRLSKQLSPPPSPPPSPPLSTPPSPPLSPPLRTF
jgi:glycine betaine/proline transport system permease protein